MFYKIKPGGSGKGLSYWLKFLNNHCPKRETLNRAFADQLREEARTAGAAEPVIFASDDSNDGTDRGTIFHALMELYYGKHPEFESPDLVTFLPASVGPGANAKAIKEGQVLADWWIQRFGRRGLGRVLSVEEQIDDTSPGVAAELAARFERTDVTAKLDLVTAIDTPADAQEVNDLFEANDFPLATPVRPGLLMIDFKSTLDGGSGDKLEYGWQEIHYPWMYYLKHGIKVEQFAYLQVAIGRKKTPEPVLDVITHPYPSDEKIDALCEQLRIAMAMEAIYAGHPNAANRKACAPRFKNGNWCRHLDVGCKGY